MKRIFLAPLALLPFVACSLTIFFGSGCGGSNSSSSAPTPTPSPTPTPLPGSSRFTITDLGVRPTALSSVGFGINSQGEIAGDSDIHGVVWNHGVLTDLDAVFAAGNAPAGTMQALNATAINDLGQVVGGNNIESSGTASDNHAFLWQNGTFTDLGVLQLTPNQSLNYSFAFGINNLGQVVGYSGNSTNFHGFVWQNGTMTDLGVPGTGSFSQATAINSSGQIVLNGNYGGTNIHTYLWSSGAFTDLGQIPGSGNTYGNAINDAGHIVGESDTGSSTSFTKLGYEWINGTLTSLKPITNDLQCVSTGINNHEQIVGTSYGANNTSRAVLWENGAAEDLQTLIPANSGWSLEGATKINDASQITGFGKINGEDHAFLISPLPAD